MRALLEPVTYPPHEQMRCSREDPCELCDELAHHGSVERMQQEASRQVRRLTWRPPYQLRAIGRAWPEVEWLAWLPPDEAAFYLRPPQLERLTARFPRVPEGIWQQLIRRLT